MHNGIIHVYSYGLFSHTRRRQNSPIRKWTNINIFFTDITAFRLFNMNHCEALIFSHEADWGIRLDTVLCPRFHPFEIIH